MQEMQLNWFFVSAKGGTIDFVTPEGELLMQVAVPAGRVGVREYLELCPEGAEVQISKGLVAVPPKGGYAVQVHPEALETAADPDWQPTSADPMQRKLMSIVQKLASDNASLNRKVSALAIAREAAPAAAPAAQSEETLPVGE